MNDNSRGLLFPLLIYLGTCITTRYARNHFIVLSCRLGGKVVNILTCLTVGMLFLSTWELWQKTGPKTFTQPL